MFLLIAPITTLLPSIEEMIAGGDPFIFRFFGIHRKQDTAEQIFLHQTKLITLQQR